MKALSLAAGDYAEREVSKLEAKAESGRDLVIYSGGADSTLLLDEKARAEDGAPVVALTVEEHPQLHSLQLEGQRRARAAYLAWATAHKRKLTLVALRVTTPAYGLTDGGGVTADNPQAMVWMAMLLPYVRSGDRVHLGFIKADEFWHTRALFDQAFAAMCAWKGIKATVHYDLEWATKTEVVLRLQALKIPPRCIWTCDEPLSNGAGPIACGTCHKCKELLEVCSALPRRPKKPQPEGLAALTRRLGARNGKGASFRW